MTELGGNPQLSILNHFLRFYNCSLQLQGGYNINKYTFQCYPIKIKSNEWNTSLLFALSFGSVSPDSWPPSHAINLHHLYLPFLPSARSWKVPQPFPNVTLGRGSFLLKFNKISIFFYPVFAFLSEAAKADHIGLIYQSSSSPVAQWWENEANLTQMEIDFLSPQNRSFISEVSVVCEKFFPHCSTSFL